MAPNLKCPKCMSAMSARGPERGMDARPWLRHSLITPPHSTQSLVHCPFPRPPTTHSPSTKQNAAYSAYSPSVFASSPGRPCKVATHIGEQCGCVLSKAGSGRRPASNQARFQVVRPPPWPTGELTSAAVLTQSSNDECSTSTGPPTAGRRVRPRHSKLCCLGLLVAPWRVARGT
ncbi:uncharacterized protein EI97DRAFT_159435 [Westerdykella ornata]|uniref:Uncharacterized protein n=1 Tax=Westerdykella ornata TaxID=318751 RepID=A0A6A6JCY3_WESOR|nr:uncharacterized protein EI97DRAFT_159435 [Westerdykella ornata]KAF2273486.1 hypothetical protein EI97DRAFT_159435 [Westerdykella ornata]